MTHERRHTADGIRLLVHLLMTDLRGVDPAAVRPRLWAEPVRGWLTAGAALAAGEPKRALAALDDPEPEETYDDLVTRTLRTAATAMDVNWSPGGTVPWALPQRDESALLHALDGTQARLTILGRDPGLRLAAFLAARYLPDLLAARAVLGSGEILDAQPPEVTAAVGGAAEVGEAVRWFDEVPREIAEGGLAAAVAYHLLIAGDVRARAGDRRGREALSAQALRLVPRDPAFAAMASLLAGDAELGAPGAAERCLPVPAARRTLDRAARHYEAADTQFRKARADRGRAAAMLRLAHVARLRRKPTDRTAYVDRALALAASADDRACVALLKAHRMLDAVEDGRSLPAGDVAEVRRWAATVGSGSWLRGLGHLVAARAEGWTRQGHLVLGRELGGLAQRLTEPDAARATAVPVPGAVRAPTGPMTGPVGGYHTARHRLASLVLADIELRARERQLEDRCRMEAADGQGTGPGPAPWRVRVALANAWLAAAVAAELLLDEAAGLGDPDLVATTRTRLQRVIRLGERLLRGPGGDPTAAQAVRVSLEGMRAGLRATRAVEKLHRLRRHRSAGMAASAARTAKEAEALIEDGAPPSLARCALLVELGRLEEARAEADELETRGELTALQSAALRLRLRQPERAAEAERRIGTDGAEPEHPWDRPAIAAEASLALGEPRRAAQRALEAVTAYEEHRSRMGRDTLRAASADDPVVARGYHTAVLAQWELPGGQATAFATAERARSGFLDTVHALDSAAGRPDEQRAVRGWLQAEARWAARFEEAADVLRSEGHAAAGHQPPQKADTADERCVRRRLAEAERTLAAAEAEVRRLAPRALTARRGPGALPDAALTGALPPDTVMLQYHLFDQDLVGWAVTREGLLADRHRRSADDLVATARRFHAACASGSDATRSGRALFDALLGFCAPLLTRHRKILVVPPARLALVPFHALPMDGAVLGLTHDVSYLPAVSLLTRPGSRTPEPDWREATALLVGAPATADERALAYLPGTVTEVATVERLLRRCRVLTGPDADRKRVLEQAAGCSVLHLATHGDVQELTPYLSRLALAGQDHLGVDDLLSCDVTPDLLVLSACDTGRGTATAGGDVLGLTRTAVISGARHAVVSLWPVDDMTGCLVITRMYRYLTSADRPSVGTALARAQREVRAASPDERETEYTRLAERAGLTADPAGPRVRARDSGPRPAGAATDPYHPFHWAPFIHVGPSGEPATQR
ncbi:CHAT domain-containing protein [Streptomyces sp. NPDC001920]